MNLDPRIIALSITALIGALGLFMLFRGMRSVNKGVRSCPKCQHLLSGTTGLRCTECGYLARNERALLRANRSRFSALIGLLLVVCSVSLVQRLDQAQRMFALAPDRFLVMLLPYSPPATYDDGIHAEIHARARRGTLGADARQQLLARIISGDDSAAPGTDAWEFKYAPLAIALRSGLPSNDPLLDRFAEITPLVKTMAPAQWPPGLPVVIMIDLIRFDSNEQGSTVRIDGLSRESLLFRHRRLNRSEFPLALTLEQPGDSGIDRTLALTIESSAAGAPAHEHEIALHVEPAPSMLSKLEPRDTPRMTRILGESVFRYGISLYEQGDPPWSLRFSPRSTQREAFANVLIGLEVELLRNGVPARRSFIWWHGGVGRAAWETSFEDRPLMENALGDDATWTLRISGREEIALRAGIGNSPAADAWWSGSFEMPIQINAFPGSIQPREWEPIRPPASEEPTC